MTPGRVHEALAAAATARLSNAVLHVDWNQASIDSNRVCRGDDGAPGEYVQWQPAEICYCHDWNVIVVPDGTDFVQVLAAQRLALELDTRQPTAVIYRTTKGWRYGIEGKDSHGAGHAFCSPEYYASLAEFEERFGVKAPRFETPPSGPVEVEEAFFETLMGVRLALESDPGPARFAARRLGEARERLRKAARRPREGAPRLEVLYGTGDAGSEGRGGGTAIDPGDPPEGLRFEPGASVTLRGALGDALGFLNRATGGALFAAAADLYGSTSVTKADKGFDEGFFDSVSNPGSRLVAVGGICEDAMGAFMAGVSSFGRHIGVSSSYAAFIASMEHVPARVHCIGQQARRDLTGEPYRTWIMINGHAGPKTGEDGPTHADPQGLQLLQGDFAAGTLITLTPWDAREVWPLLVEGIRARPAVLCPFVTRPADVVVDREALRLPPPEAAVEGLYALRRADPAAPSSGTLVLQGNAVATIFVQEVLPELDAEGLNLNVFYVSSAELFDRLPEARRREIYPEPLALEAIGITDFTLPTLDRWVRSEEGRRRSLHPLRAGHYLGSGKARKVLEEAGIHAAGQVRAILEYARARGAR